jgi:hypothetical protein
VTSHICHFRKHLHWLVHRDGTISVKIVRSQIELRLSCVVHMGIRTCDMVVHGVSCVLR